MEGEGDFVEAGPYRDEGSAFASHGPAGDDVAGDRAEFEELLQVVGDLGVLAEEDLDVTEVEEVLGDLLRLRPGMPCPEIVRGFVGIGDLNIPCLLYTSPSPRAS